ncbi:MAG: ATP-dependent DNA helicase RecG [Clostridia bacterium]|nr:ATP-dependent DNA helicase RecG [Clostridia bacterium]
MELKNLKGLGKIRLSALEKAGIVTVEDLLMSLPRSYRDTSVVTPIAEIREGVPCCVSGYLKAAPKLARFRGISRTTATLCDETGKLLLVWYNQPWIKDQVSAEEPLLLFGKPERDKGGRLFMNSPHREKEQALIPEYAAPAGFPNAIFADLIRQALSSLEECCPETLPESIRLTHHLCERNFAIRQIHAPETKEALALAQRRLAFEQLLLYQAALSILRGTPGRATPIPCSRNDASRFWQQMPFPPTKAQERVLEEILRDMQQNTAMRRMVQGDVGCGKTAIAFGAISVCALSGHQSALMAPTEILARQHFESAQKLLAPMGIQCGLLLGGMKAKERREALKNIKSGAWQVIIGTHALLSESVEYHDLALAVTDEQHRFGVRQRQILSQKAQENREPHVLVMSATPIPRSLALILYGDLELSVVDELPPGRTPVLTRIVPEYKRNGLYGFVKEQASECRQIYIVCPLVEESEAIDAVSAQEMYADLVNGPLSSLRIGLTYGTQDAAEKEKTLAAFSAGDIDVLVSTTVIEVGVNVPNATVMIIENAERFGLSQLHQLRGRVGRGSRESWCFLMAEPNERLNTLCSTNDGFVIARKDLEMRGPGEFLGTRQHGASMFSGMQIDAVLIEETQKCIRMLEKDPSQAEALSMIRSSAKKLFAAHLKQVVLN